MPSTGAIYWPSGGVNAADGFGGALTNPGNVAADDGVYADSGALTGNTRGTKYGNWGLGALVPAGVAITSVVVEYQFKVSATAGGPMAIMFARVGGTSQGSHSDSTAPTTDKTVSVDITGDRAWTRADLLDGTFEVTLQGSNGTPAATISFDFLRVTIGYANGTPPTVPFPATPILDDFNRTNENPVAKSAVTGSALWGGPIDSGGSQLKVVSNGVQSAGTGAGHSYWKTVFAADQEVFVTFHTGAGPRLYLRITGENSASLTCYVAIFSTSGSTPVDIYKVVNNTYTYLGSFGSTSLADGDRVGFRAVGTRLSCLVNGLEVASTTDGSITGSGKIGLYIGSPSVSFDDFGGGVSTNVAFKSYTTGGPSSGVSVAAAPVAAGDTAQAGDLLVLVSNGGIAGNVVTQVTDTKGNTWALAKRVASPGSSEALVETVEVWYCVVTTPMTSTDSVTVTWSVSVANKCVIVAHFTGLTSTPLDKTNGAFVSNPGSGLFGTGGSGVLTQAQELVLGFFWTYVSPGALGTWTPGADFGTIGLLTWASNAMQMYVEWKPVAATTTQNPAALDSITPTENTGIVATFKVNVPTFATYSRTATDNAINSFSEGFLTPVLRSRTLADTGLFTVVESIRVTCSRRLLDLGMSIGDSVGVTKSTLYFRAASDLGIVSISDSILTPRLRELMDPVLFIADSISVVAQHRPTPADTGLFINDTLAKKIALARTDTGLVMSGDKIDTPRVFWPTDTALFVSDQGIRRALTIKQPVDTGLTCVPTLADWPTRKLTDLGLTVGVALNRSKFVSLTDTGLTLSIAAPSRSQRSFRNVTDLGLALAVSLTMSSKIVQPVERTRRYKLLVGKDAGEDLTF